MADTPPLLTVDALKDYVSKNPGPYVDPKTGDAIQPGGAQNTPPPSAASSAAGGGNASTASTGSVGKDATPSSAGLIFTPDPNQPAIDSARTAAGKASGYLDANGNPQAAPDESTVRKNVMDSFQSEIDALNAASASARARITQQYGKIDEQRVGSQRALLANSGMLGQESGFSEKANLDSNNAAELGAAVDKSDAEFADKVSALMGQARTLGTQTYQAKLDAYTKGADATVSYLKDRQTVAANNAQAIAKNAYNSGIDLTDPKNSDTITNLAKQIGISPEILKSTFSDTKKTLDAAKIAAEQAGRFKLGPGETQYDVNGNPIAKGADKLTAAKDAAGNPITFDETTGKYLDNTGKPVDTTQVDPTSLGIDQASISSFLKGRPDTAAKAFQSIPPEDRGSVMLLVNGDALLTDLVKSRGIQGTAAIKKLINEAQSVDSNYSPTNEKVRYTFKQDWSNPNSSAFKTRTSLNTAVGHLAELQNEVNKLQGTNYKISNGVMQFIDKNVNNDQTQALANFNYIASQLAIELGKAYNGGVPSDTETTRNLNLMNAANPTQVNSAVIGTAANLLDSLLTSTATEYKNVMGVFPNSQILQSDKLDALQAAGVNTQKITQSLIKQGMKASSVKDYEAAFPEAKTKVDQLVKENPSLSEQDVLQILQGPSPYLSNVGTDTNSGSSTVGAARTDRNNNPTAMTTAVAKDLGLVEGKDYVKGDPFIDENGKTLYTAKILGDPVATTIKGIDQGGFYTSGGVQRWSHTAITPMRWNSLSYNQKAAIVKSMYQKEGNKGALNQYFS